MFTRLLCAASSLILAFMLQAPNVHAAVQSVPEGEAVQTNAPTSGTPTGIASAQAKAHIGESNTVCGVVVGARYLTTAKTKPTFLNFDRPFPDHSFSVMIPDAIRSQFKGPPEQLFNGKIVCVSGLIKEYKGTPEIVISDASQIAISQEAKTGDTNAVPKSAEPAQTP